MLKQKRKLKDAEAVGIYDNRKRRTSRKPLSFVTEKIVDHQRYHTTEHRLRKAKHDHNYFRNEGYR